MHLIDWKWREAASLEASKIPDTERHKEREREGERVMKSRFTSFLTANDVNIKVVLNDVVLNSSNDVSLILFQIKGCE